MKETRKSKNLVYNADTFAEDNTPQAMKETRKSKNVVYNADTFAE